MIILIDNYDSFTYNLVHYLGELGAQTTVHRNDTLSAADVIAAEPGAIVLSPGPLTPDKAGICIELVRAAAGRIPLLGICLGHQAIGAAFGAKVVRADKLMHGKLSPIHHRGTGLFEGIADGFQATRYHSLVLEPASMPECLETTATSDRETIMGIAHRKFPIHGVQFHPESIASEQGKVILRNFINLARL